MSSRLLPSRLGRLTVLAVCAGLTVTACGPGRTGTAVPNGGEGARYVSAKFGGALEKAYDRFAEAKSRKATVEKYLRLNSNLVESVDTIAFTADPSSMYFRQAEKTAPDKYTAQFHPPGAAVDYVEIGPGYAALAPTKWVSRPWMPDPGFGTCTNAENLTTCQMATTINEAAKKHATPITATGLGDGGTTVTAEVPLRDFLKGKVIGDSALLLDKFTDATLNETVHGEITLDAESNIQRISMNGRFSGQTKTPKPFEFEVRYAYQYQGQATPSDFPSPPPPEGVTVLPDQPAVDDFHARKKKMGA